MANYVIGLDFGTDSVRSVLVDAANGKTVATKVHWYKLWKQQMFCDAASSRFRQHVSDHLAGMEETIRAVVLDSKVSPEDIKGICIDTTGSSPIPVDANGTALCMLPGFEDNPNAMMVLWKDHTAISEAEEINRIARTWGGQDFTMFEGGIYSSEWFWAKILHIIREDKAVRKSAVSWMEHCDLMTYLLTGAKDLAAFKRSRCAAGHKAMWHERWGGLPDDAFLVKLDPDLVNIKKNLYRQTYTSDQVAGQLSASWANKLGLTEKTVVAVGTFDAHAGAVGAEVEEHTLVRVMGTSTCDIVVSASEVLGEKTVKGICGQVDGSVVPGMVGLEAGQSAFGDALAWFRDVLAWPIDHLDWSLKLSTEEKDKLKDEIILKLSTEAEKLGMSDSSPVALDWINGRRTPDANQALKAAIINLNLGTKSPEIFKAIVESICFGSRKIVERFLDEGVMIKSVVGIGGVAKKSPFVMQRLADVLNMPIKIATSEQAPALGSAMYAAVAAGLYKNVSLAAKVMGNGFEKTYFPDPARAKVYDRLYKQYKALGDFVESGKDTTL